MISRETAQTLAHRFRATQDSPLYLFASTGGTLWSKTHREGCRRSIRTYLRRALSGVRDDMKRRHIDADVLEKMRENLRMALRLDAYLAKASISPVSYNSVHGKLSSRSNPRRRNPIDYALAQKLFRKHKSILTRAQNSGDPRKVIAACDAFTRDFENNNLPFPDDWARWERARDDAMLKLRYGR